MPPKAIVTKKDVVKASLSLIIENGYGHVNARNIAKKLNCSTNPLFRIYKNMDELREDIFVEAEKYYEAYLDSETLPKSSPFLQMGLNYISFAKNKKNLFKFIFLSDNIKIDSFNLVADMANNPEIIAGISRSSCLNESKSKELFSNVWLLTHGIACTIATNQYLYNEDEIKRILLQSYEGNLIVLKGEK